jgi:hypothetical protein
VDKKTTDPARPLGRLVLREDLVWPVAIAVALAVVVLVNVAFIYIAVSDADDVAPSYTAGER